MQLLQWIKSLLAPRSYQDGVEKFVRSKNPTNTAEVEYWVQYYYSRENHRGYIP